MVNLLNYIHCKFIENLSSIYAKQEKFFKGLEKVSVCPRHAAFFCVMLKNHSHLAWLFLALTKLIDSHNAPKFALVYFRLCVFIFCT
jgi:hypothetical protein